MRLLVAALALMSSVAVAAPPCTVSGLPNIKGKSYHLARGMMIEAGALPVMEPTPEPDNMDVTVRDLYPLGYNEVEGCAGSGLASCRFAWMLNGKQFFIITQGETRHLVRRVLCSTDRGQ